MKKNALALILAICMVISVLPAAAFAAEAPQAVVKTAPVELDKLAGTLPGISAQASYKISLTGGSNGTTELLVDSPAAVGSKVYFVADPEDGYLAEVYVDGIDPSQVYYTGYDVWGFYMPANKVTIEVRYVEAPGKEHRIDVIEGEGGQYAIARDSAKEGESVYLAVKPNNAAGFDPTLFVMSSDLDAYYLFEEDGIYYYELFMSDIDSFVIVAYKITGPHKADTFISGKGTVTYNPGTAYFTDIVTATIVPDPGYRLVSARCAVHAGAVVYDLVPVGGDRYTFMMPPESPEVYVIFEPNINPVTVVMETTLGGSVTADVTEAMAGDTVTLTAELEEGYRVAQIIGVDYTDNSDGTYSFVMPEDAVDIHVWILREDNPFLDVLEKKFYYESVMWAVEKGITEGVDENTFAPKAPCTRGQVVTFLWRALGSPEPTTTEHPFTDVKEGKYYYKAMLWAVENGITAGLTPTTFAPNEPCTRGQVVTFLWRAYGEQAPTSEENPFADVIEGKFYFKAVLWAVENDVTSGATPTTFDPNGTCTRGHVVTFLYRADQIPEPEPEPDPTEPVKTYELVLKDNGNGTVAYVDGKTTAAPGESIFFYAVPYEGYELTNVGIFNPTNEIDVSKIQLNEHGDDLYELVMIDHDIIMTCYFTPVA